MEKIAEASTPGTCSQPNLDRLVRVFCDSRIRPGIREYYPLFGTREGEVRSGYDVDVGRALAKHLGVAPVFVRVNAATRIPLLGEGRIDVIIATMGHNTQRDGQVRFIRPHYYQSETTLVGPTTPLPVVVPELVPVAVGTVPDTVPEGMAVVVVG